MLRRCLAFASLAALAPSALAGALPTGELQFIAPPFSVQEDAAENNALMGMFAERQNVTLTAPVAIDVSSSGVFNENADLTPTNLPAGTLVSSYLVVADASDSRTFRGTLTFDEPILGVVMVNTSLHASHAALGLTGTVTYPASGSLDANRASAKFGGFGQQVTVNLGSRTVDIVSTVDFSGDETYNLYRVLTAPTAVPEPVGCLLAAVGIALPALRRVR